MDKFIKYAYDNHINTIKEIIRRNVQIVSTPLEKFSLLVENHLTSHSLYGIGINQKKQQFTNIDKDVIKIFYNIAIHKDFYVCSQSVFLRYFYVDVDGENRLKVEAEICHINTERIIDGIISYRNNRIKDVNLFSAATEVIKNRNVLFEKINHLQKYNLDYIFLNVEKENNMNIIGMREDDMRKRFYIRFVKKNRDIKRTLING